MLKLYEWALKEGKEVFGGSWYSLETSPTQVVARIPDVCACGVCPLTSSRTPSRKVFGATPWQCASARENFPVACIHFQSHPSPATGPSSL